jgi:hypothetical protein
MFSISIAKQEVEENRAAKDGPVPTGYLAKTQVYQISGFPHRGEKPPTHGMATPSSFNAFFTPG